MEGQTRHRLRAGVGGGLVGEPHRLCSITGEVQAVNRRTYSVVETAEMLGVDPQTVRAWIATGRLAAVRPGGEHGRYLVLAESIDRMLVAEAVDRRG